MSLGKFPDSLLNFSGHIMNGEEKHFYRFESFRLDVKERRLFHNDVPVALEPKVFDVLAVLVGRSGRLVEKDELLRTVWADSFVEEGNIARIVYTLRKILGEERGGQKYIETVAKKGYRFVAEVSEIREQPFGQEIENGKEDFSAATDFFEMTAEGKIYENESQIAHSVVRESVPPSVTKPKHRTRAVLFGIAFLSLVCLLLFLSFNFQFGSRAKPNEIKSIAVLPLKPINTAARDEIYEIGIADSLINRFSSAKSFIVRPLNAIRKYADIQQDALAAGKEQQVDYVFASNYQLANGKIRITAQLYNVANGQIEETYKSEKDVSDVFAMQDAVADEFGNRLQARFATASSNISRKRGTSNEEAYRLYLQGIYLYDKHTAADSQKAVEIFEQALRLDPYYAQAWAAKAYAHRSVANFQRNVDIHEEHRKSIEAINKALAINENLAEAYSALCDVKILYEWDFANAERICKRAIELDPNLSQAHQSYSRFLSSQRRFDEAIAELQIAIDLEPASLFIQRNYADGLRYARRYDEAVAQYKRVIAMDENFGTAYMFLSNTLGLQGKEAEAFEWFMKGMSPRKRDKETIQAFQTAYRESGWQGVLRERAAKFEKSNEAYFHGAAYCAQIGDKDKAFEYLENAFQRRELWVVYLQVDPRLDSLHSDSRFDDLVTRVGLK